MRQSRFLAALRRAIRAFYHSLLYWCSGDMEHPTDTQKFKSRFEDRRINPATGLPMMGGGGIDVGGNPYGVNLQSNHFRHDKK